MNTKLNVSGGAQALLCAAVCIYTLFVGGCNDHISDDDIKPITLSETRILLQDKPGVARAVDTRPPVDFAVAHIPGAVNLEMSGVSNDKDSIDPALAKFKTLIVYGEDAASGSAKAMTKRLIIAGHKNVRYLAGGMAEWTANGLKTEGTGQKPKAPAPPSSTQAPPPVSK